MAPSRSVLWHICTILQTQMGLTDDQITIYNQKKLIPTLDGAWVTVGLLSCKAIGNVSTFTSGALEKQSVNMQAVVSIDIQSRNFDALDRKEQILLALGSLYSQRIQELYGFRIGRIPVGFVNLSQVEGAAIPYRFSISFQVIYQVTSQQSVDYYDTFNDTFLPEA